MPTQQEADAAFNVLYFWAGFIVPPLLWGAVTLTGNFWVTLAFWISCLVFFFHAIFLFVAFFAVDIFRRDGLTEALWFLVMSGAAIGAVFAVGAVLSGILDFGANVAKNAKNPPTQVQNVHHYHHITTDQDLRAEVTDIRREDDYR